MARSSVGVKDSGSNYNYFEEPRKPRLSKSLFDLSYINSGTAEIGQLIPIYLQETVPGDEFTINCEAVLRAVNPPVVPLLSRLRVFFHFYWSSCESLWKGFPMFITKGRSGNYSIEAPQVFAHFHTDSGEDGDPNGTNIDLTPNSLFHHLGLMTSRNLQVTNSSPASVDDCSTLAGYCNGFSAMPFMMYMRIYRDYYMNQTLVNAAAAIGDNNYLNGQDTSWFPVDDEEFRLPVNNYQGGHNIITPFAYQDSIPNDPDTGDPVNVPSFLTAIGVQYRLGAWRFRNFADDYFTTARPWPQRGDEATLGVSVTDPEVYIKSTDEDGSGVPFRLRGYGEFGSEFYFHGAEASDGSPQGMSSSAAQGYLGQLFGEGVTSSSDSTYGQNDFMLTLAQSGSLSITLSALRELNSAQRIMEKMALVDGSYGSFCVTFFGVNDPNARNFKPQYIGGCYQPITISEVLQVGGTTATSDQGEQSGHASSYGQGNIGKFFSPSYGYIMGIMSIMPDTYYSQGVNRQFTRLTQDQWFIPERSGLSPQAILNKEIYFYQGVTHTNDDLFGYQDRYDEMRYRPNEIHGQVANPNSLSFFPYTQSRYFVNQDPAVTPPTLSPEFVEIGKPTLGSVLTEGVMNLRKDWLTSSAEFPFIYQVANKVRAVRPLSYRHQPAELFDTRG